VDQTSSERAPGKGKARTTSQGGGKCKRWQARPCRGSRRAPLLNTVGRRFRLANTWGFTGRSVHHDQTGRGDSRPFLGRVDRPRREATKGLGAGHESVASIRDHKELRYSRRSGGGRERLQGGNSEEKSVGERKADCPRTKRRTGEKKSTPVSSREIGKGVPGSRIQGGKKKKRRIDLGRSILKVRTFNRPMGEQSQKR